MSEGEDVELRRCCRLARDAAWNWVGQLEGAGISEPVNRGVRLLEEWMEDNWVNAEAKQTAIDCYRSVATSSLREGGPERNAARSVAHGVFALYFHSQGNNEKLQKSIRNCIDQARIALRSSPNQPGNIGRMRRDE